MPLRYNWPDAELLKKYNGGQSCEELAAALSITDQFGVAHQPTSGGVRRRLVAIGCLMRPSGAAGERNGAWKGGKRIDEAGYVQIRMPEHPDANNGYVPEHRLVAERVLGRRLKPEEVVHHKDDDKQNNAPTNLVVYPDNATHMRETRKGIRPNWSPEGLAKINAARAARVARCAAAKAKRERNKPVPISRGIPLG